ncbi:hypothetical protein [Gordonia rhizosphera]|uniref:Uncharacterized protein n=1 Tax=Gordonia rhizosphera NBRC 16068 TaxID=1108045 RepID=K6WAB8_9ACTN|nr:hypothetical protein [Gordonia rhizosphera]GAB89147.1 hypothetical protein GORHZ_052_00160 [Gordonia rhizosphera NBRC 16068]
MGDMSEGVNLSDVRAAITSAGQALEFSEDALTPAVRACTDLINVLANIQVKVQSLQNVHGMEGFGSSRMLATGLGARADMDAGHFGQALEEHLQTVRELRAAIEQAGKRYVEAEGGNAADLTFSHDPSDKGKLPPLLDPSQRVADQQAPSPSPISPFSPVYIPGLGIFTGS